MPSKKSSHRPASKISSAADPAVSAQNVRGSSILLSTFTPSNFQLSLFASVIQAFDSQHLRVHDADTGRLKCDHALAAGQRIHSLDWARHGSSKSDQHETSHNSKRKRNKPNGASLIDHRGSAVLALGTSESEVQIFSVDDSKVVSTLTGGHDKGVRNFKFTTDKASEGWSIGGDGRLVQWDIVKRSIKRTISLNSPSLSALAAPVTRSPQVLAASQIPIAVSVEDGKSAQTLQFDAFRQPVHSLARSGVSNSHDVELFLASDHGRSMNIYNIQQQKLAKTLIADSEVLSVDLQNGASDHSDIANQILLATTTSGVVELFTQPFNEPSPDDPKSASGNARRKNLTSKCDASIKIILPDGKATALNVIQSSIQGADIVVAWVEGGVDVAFERIRWQDADTGQLSFRGLKEIIRSKKSTALNAVNAHGSKDLGKAYVDESHAVVLDIPGHVSLDNEHADAISISSRDDASDAEDFSDQEVDRQEAAAVQNHDTGSIDEEAVEATGDPDQEMQDVNADIEQNADVSLAPASDEEDAEPTFGDLVEARAVADPISIADAVADPSSNALVPSSTKDKSSLQSLPSGHSLSTILSQSLRTNDQSLLESCFHETDASTIRLTIQRLDSSLAGLLLQKLAERVSRPGRYAQLLVWIQWICVAHGGVVASRPDVLQKIRTLNAALTKRSHALDSLLLLKGKLDMLDAQVGLRRAMAAQRAGTTARQANEENVIYIEGQNESSSSDDDEMIGFRPKGKRKIGKSLQELAEGKAEDELEDEGVPMVNGVASVSEDEDKDVDEEDEDEGDDDEEYDDDDDSDILNGGDLVDTEAVLDSDTGALPVDVSEDESEVGEDEDEDEDEDEEMDNVINDGEISVAESHDELDVEDTPERPSKKHKKR